MPVAILANGYSYLRDVMKPYKPVKALESIYRSPFNVFKVCMFVWMIHC